MEKLYKEFRCPQCHKLLFKGLLENGNSKVEVKCKGCGQICTFDGSSGINDIKSQSPPEKKTTDADGVRLQMVFYLTGLSLSALYLFNQCNLC